jgi:O-methyltransferase
MLPVAISTLRGVALLEEGPEHYAAWKYLCDILRDGQQDGFVREFGHPLFLHVVENADYGAVFNAAMSKLRQQLDHGHLLGSLLAQYPALRGTVYDLASVIKGTGRLWAHKMAIGERCVYVAGDMFQEVPTAETVLEIGTSEAGEAERPCRKGPPRRPRGTPDRELILSADTI